MALYPSGDSGSQWFQKKYPGDEMDPNVIVLHTTEGTSWPDYAGGGNAPNFTLKGKDVRQHFHSDVSSRALRNKDGGVETNTLNDVQIELVGTCSKSGYGFYWPGAAKEQLEPLADLIVWLVKEHKIPVVAAKKWLPYPASYGDTDARFSFSEWEKFKGICGHQHVPENDHGDPGNFPIDTLLSLVNAKLGEKDEPAPSKPKPAKKYIPFPGEKYFTIGRTSSTITAMGRALVRAGWTGYKFGPGPVFTGTDKKAVEWFQRKQGWTGADADGIPGPKTWKLLKVYK